MTFAIVPDGLSIALENFGFDNREHGPGYTALPYRSARTFVWLTQYLGLRSDLNLDWAVDKKSYNLR